VQDGPSEQGAPLVYAPRPDSDLPQIIVAEAREEARTMAQQLSKQALKAIYNLGRLAGTRARQQARCTWLPNGLR